MSDTMSDNGIMSSLRGNVTYALTWKACLKNLTRYHRNSLKNDGEKCRETARGIVGEYVLVVGDYA